MAITVKVSPLTSQASVDDLINIRNAAQTAASGAAGSASTAGQHKTDAGQSATTAGEQAALAGQHKTAADQAATTAAEQAALAGQHKDASAQSAQQSGEFAANAQTREATAAQHASFALAQAGTAATKASESASHAAESLTHRNAAEDEAAKAKQSADNAAAVVTGGTASLTAEAGKIPLADAGGKIDSDWLVAGTVPAADTIPVADADGVVDADYLGKEIGRILRRQAVESRIKPSLDLDFANQTFSHYDGEKYVEHDYAPFITHTRASTGTYFGPDGVLRTAANDQPRFDHDPATGEPLGLLVEESRTNYVTRSEHPSSFDWGYSGNLTVSLRYDAIMAPNNTLTGTKYIRTPVSDKLSGHVSLHGQMVAGASYTLSGFYKYDGSLAEHVALGGFFGGEYAVFNLITGVEAVARRGANVTSTSSKSVGGGWFRFSVTYIFQNVTDNKYPYALAALLYTSNPATQVAADSSGSVYIWGLQYEKAAFPTSYIPTKPTFTSRASTKTYFDANGVMQTAAINEAAMDHGYVDGRWVSKGLSVEGAATNLWKWSDDATKLSGFGTIRSTDRVIADTNTGDHHVYPHLPEKEGVVGVLSFRIKKIGSGTPSIYINSLNDGSTAIVDMSIGVSTSPLIHVVPEGDGWFRVEATTKVVGSNPRIYLHNGTTYNFTGDGVSGAYIKNIQWEEGTTATSCIPTSGSQVTRSADVVSSAQATRMVDTATASLIEWYKSDVVSLYTEVNNHCPMAVNTAIRGSGVIFTDSANTFQKNKITVEQDAGSFNTPYIYIFGDGVTPRADASEFIK